MIHRVTICQGVGCRFLAPSWPDANCPQCGGALLIAALVGGEEEQRLRQIENAVWNYLGTKDPKAVGDWINGARLELTEHRAAEGRLPWERSK